MGGERRVAFGERPLGVGLASSQDRLGHHDRPVDDDAEIDRAERQQIGGDVRQVHQDERDQHGERDGEADDHRRARTAEKQHEDDDDEADALEDGVRDLVDRRVDEVGAVDIGNDPHVVALEPLVELGDLGVDAVDHPRRVLATQQQHRSLDRIVLAVVAENAVALLVGELEAAEIAEQHGIAVLLGDHDGAEIVERLHQADAAHDVAEIAPRDDAAAGAGVVVVDRGLDVGERQVEPHELLRVELELELGGEAAEIRDVGDAGHLLERGNDRPELNLGQIAQTLGVGFERVIVDLPGGRAQGVERRRQAGRQDGVLDALVDTHAPPVILGAVAEHERDQRQAEGALRAHDVQPGRAVELALQRDGDALLHLLRRHAGRLRDDLGAGVGDVGVGFDRELGPGVIPVDGEEEADHRHDRALAQRQGDEGVNH